MLSCSQSLSLADRDKMRVLRISERTRDEIFQEMNDALSQVQSELASRKRGVGDVFEKSRK